MGVFLTGSNPLDQFKCDLCGQIFVKAAIHEHHLVKRASGGQDEADNIARLDAYCHHALHQVESALKKPKKGTTATDLASALYPNNQRAQKKVLELAAIAAMGRDISQELDPTQWDTDDRVGLPIVMVSPKVRKQAKIVAKELKNPKTGRALGVSAYLEMLLLSDLRKRGFDTT